MKKYLLTLPGKILIINLTLLWSAAEVTAQCPAGPVTLTTQAQVDNFQTDYPGCTYLGHLTIGSSTDIVNLNGLSGLVKLTGSLTISQNAVLVDISGLSNLIEVGDKLIVVDNPGLTTIDFSNIAGFLGRFEITGNNSLETLKALVSVKSTSGFYTKQFAINH